LADIIPTDRECEALKVLWERETATVREVWQELNAADADVAYTTALSLMQVMEQKGLVGHRVDGKTYIYYPRVERGNIFERLASRFLERVFDGAMDEYLVHALAGRRPSDAELERLERMIAEAKAKTRRKRRK